MRWSKGHHGAKGTDLQATTDLLMAHQEEEEHLLPEAMTAGD